MPTAYHMSWLDKTTPNRKILWCARVYDTTQPKLGIVVSDLAILDIFDKAQFLFCHGLS